MTRKPNMMDTYDLGDIETRAKSWADETDMFKKKSAKGPRTDKRFNGKPYFCALCGKPARFPPARRKGKGAGCLQHRLETKKQAMARSHVERAKEALAREFDPEHPSRKVNPFTEQMLGDMLSKAYNRGDRYSFTANKDKK